MSMSKGPLAGLLECIDGLEAERDGGWSPAAESHLRRLRVFSNMLRSEKAHTAWDGTYDSEGHPVERQVAAPDDKLERLKIEAERWTAAVASDGSLAGSAAYELRHLIGQAHDLGLSARSATLPKTLPKELTPQMIEAGATECITPHITAGHRAAAVWRAMLAAAPVATIDSSADRKEKS